MHHLGGYSKWALEKLVTHSESHATRVQCHQCHFHAVVQESVKSESSADKLSPVNLGQQLQYLQHQLTDLHLEKLLGPEASIDLSDPQGALRQWVPAGVSEKDYCYFYCNREQWNAFAEENTFSNYVMCERQWLCCTVCCSSVWCMAALETVAVLTSFVLAVKFNLLAEYQLSGTVYWYFFLKLKHM